VIEEACGNATLMRTRYSLDYQKDEGQRLGLIPHCADDYTWLLVTPPHELLPFLRLQRYQDGYQHDGHHVFFEKGVSAFKDKRWY
jgi:hypothetical protein